MPTRKRKEYKMDKQTPSNVPKLPKNINNKPRRKTNTHTIKEMKKMTHLNDIKNSPKLEDQIKKGITTIKIENIHEQTNQQITEHKRRLFKYSVKDPQLTDIIIQDQNLQKIKHRFTHHITIKNADGDTLGKATTYYKTPNQIIDELKEILTQGQKILKGSPEIVQRLQQKGITFEHNKDGDLEKVDLHITFTKTK